MTSAAALEAGDGGQLRFDAVDALDVVNIGRVDGSVEHLEANLLRLELLGGSSVSPTTSLGWPKEAKEAEEEAGMLQGLFMESRFLSRVVFCNSTKILSF